jgi:hypothetical protein
MHDILEGLLNMLKSGLIVAGRKINRMIKDCQKHNNR